MNGKSVAGAFGWGVVVALALSGAFLGMVVLISPLLAAVVAIGAAVAVGAVRARAVPRAPAHCLVEPSFATSVEIAAPRAGASVAAAARTTATTAA